MNTPPGPEDWAHLGEAIASRRKQLGMDQRELAEAADVSENTISNYERGRVPARGKLSPGYLRVEKALHFSAGSLYAILQGHPPTYSVEGQADALTILRSPEDFQNNPLLRAVVVRMEEVLRAHAAAMQMADLAHRWNVPEEHITSYRDALRVLFVEMFTGKNAPPEVQAYDAAVRRGEAPFADALFEELDPQTGARKPLVVPPEGNAKTDED